jgi:hypothetical protein
VLFDEPIRVYHADLIYLGSTQIKPLEQSAALFHERLTPSQGSSESSDALELGRLWHTLRELGVDQFGERAVVIPSEYCTAGGAASTKKEAKEWLASQGPDAICLTQATSDTLGRMQDKFLANSAAVEIDESTLHREVSIRWESTAGVKVRCRPDVICEGGRLADWKSTREVAPLKTFCHSVKTFGYGLSAALYEQGCLLAGLADPPMHFVVSSTVTPYETQVLTLPPSYMDFCRKRLEQILLEIAERRATGNWNPSGYGSVHEISMPGFGADRSGNSGFFIE